MAGPEDTFRQTISIAELQRFDGHGKPALGTITSGRARVQPTTRTIKDANGVEFLASAIVYTALPVTTRHRIWLPGDDTADLNRSRRPARVDPIVDGAGVVRYRKVFI